ncbi:HD domain-containing protein [Heliophilum fasciatum]|uniref:Putative nucleotidyltransferase with HDIG domain n=1 Tax=Heliophilum fasciatum TaxID=35700 RepID=A0A4R2RI89_9FIRM|nr:HD domain-containing protein [Heliophilum fasciatum]MCW2278537.1 putative nucleotidyltransferase with HDIG domain [Heliophilum fasciatum]TCP63492.1 putative nucleotidyltransferase with HDIG domain [Heliophilum fasciatum]
MKKIIYRCRQVWRAVSATITADEAAWVQQWLQDKEYQVWQEMALADRRHTCDVAKLCYDHSRHLSAPEQTLLLRAALLHDLGKRRARLRLWHRILYVLLKAAGRPLDRPTAPSLAVSPLAVIVHHAHLGAREATQKNWDDELVFLIRHHHSPPLLISGRRHPWHLLQLLQDADNRC